jgi:hypothetical protein
MGVEIVDHQPNAFRRGEVPVNQQAHLFSKVRFGPLFRDIDVALTAPGLHE